jgi:hypothetical protein
MLLLNLPTATTPASVQGFSRHADYDYERTPTSSDESETDSDDYGMFTDEEMGYAHRDESATGAGAGGFGRLGRRAKTAPAPGPRARARRGAIAPPTDAPPRARRGAIAPPTDAPPVLRRQGGSDALPVPPVVDAAPILRRQGGSDDVQGQGTIDKPLADDEQQRTELKQQKQTRKERRKQRIAEAREKALETKTKSKEGEGACLRHCGTSCGSVLFQCVCSVLFIVATTWAAFIALSVFEIIGISSLPPGIAYGHRVGDVYRS